MEGFTLHPLGAGHDVICIHIPGLGFRCFPIFDPLGGGVRIPPATPLAHCPDCAAKATAAAEERAKYASQYCESLKQELKMLQEELKEAGDKARVMREIRAVLRELATCRSAQF